MARAERERRYVADYLAQYYPRGGWMTNVPLGPIPEEITSQHGIARGAMLFRPARPRVDAVIWSTSHYWLVEAKIREAKSAVGDLLVYRTLADSTPDLPEYNGQEIHTRLIVPWALDWISRVATRYGMEMEIFLPAWVEDYVRERQNYFTREVRLARDEKMRLRQVLGVE